MKKTITILLILVLLSTNCVTAFSLNEEFNIEKINNEKTFGELTSSEQQNILKLINSKKDIILEINRPNYNNPISLEKVIGENYNVSLWDEFYALGSVEFLIQDKEGNIIYQNILNGKDSININLENAKDYYYDIKVNCNDGTTMLYFGEIFTNENEHKITNILYRDQDNYNYLNMQNDGSTLQEEDMVIETISQEDFIVPMKITPTEVREVESNNSTSLANVI